MTRLLTRPEPPAPGVAAGAAAGADRSGPGRLVATGLLAAGWAAAAGLLPVVVLVVVAWATAPGGAGSVADAVRAGGWAWLALHHTGFRLSGATVGLLPLGGLLLPVLLLRRAGRWAAGATGTVGGWRAGALTGVLGAGYAAVAVAVALASRTAAGGPVAWQAGAAGLALGLGAGGWGVLRAAGWRPDWPGRVPTLLRVLARGAAVATALLVAAGALLLAVSLAVHLPEVAALTRALNAGTVGGPLLVAAQVAYLPNLAVWAAAVTVGPGFAVGAGTAVALRGVTLGALPGVPLLAALPAPGPVAGVGLVALAGPLVAGVAAGLVVVRRLPLRRLEQAAGWAAAAGALAGLPTGVLAALSGGPLGPGRWATVGPSPWQVAVATAAEVSLAAAGAAALAHGWRTRRAAPPSA